MRDAVCDWLLPKRIVALGEGPDGPDRSNCDRKCDDCTLVGDMDADRDMAQTLAERAAAGSFLSGRWQHRSVERLSELSGS